MNEENRVLNANPYGSIEAEDIERFEKRLPLNLPKDYRDYLLRFNGGDFEKSCIPSSNDNGDTHTISELFSLHRGPEGSRLERNWDLSEFYDLHEFSHLTENYLAFGTSGTGDIFLIKFETGEVLIYLHDYIYHVPSEGPGGAIFPISSSFTELVSKAISEKELLKGAVETDPEFAARLEKLKKESGLWD